MTSLDPEGPASRDRRGGFALAELMLALVIISLLAALAFPQTRFGRSANLQRFEASRLVALLRADRNAALRSGRTVSTNLDLARRRIASGAAGGTIVLPQIVSLTSRPAGLTEIVFAPDGRSSGGALVLAAGQRRLVVRIDPVTAAIHAGDR